MQLQALERQALGHRRLNPVAAMPTVADVWVLPKILMLQPRLECSPLAGSPAVRVQLLPLWLLEQELVDVPRPRSLPLPLQLGLAKRFQN